MAFLTGLKLAAALTVARFYNNIGGLSIHTPFNGVYRKSSFNTKNQNAARGSIPGGGAQECHRRRIGGFYGMRKHDVF